MTSIGARIGAIASGNAKEVHLFGYGVYLGDEVPPPEIIGPFGGGIKSTNPKLQLDNGDVVWGCECWWGPEEKVKASIGDRKIVTITPKEYRAQGTTD